MFSSCNQKFFAVKHIHYPVHPSSDHFHTDEVVPSSDHCRSETILPPSDHYYIVTVAQLGDHSCIDITLLGVIQVLRNARGDGWVYAQALLSVTRGGGGGVTSALRNVIFVYLRLLGLPSCPTRISK